jgi:hypothetical protein
MPKWAPLTRYLLEADEDRLELSLSEIENILGAPLPVSARRHRSIVWSNSTSNPYARIWRNAGYRSSLRGLSMEEVAFVREGVAETFQATPPRPLSETTVVLLGCVKTRSDRPMPAADLYQSTLFRRRRAYAEATGKPWFVLSALHGALVPTDVIEPHDLNLDEQSVSYRHAWAARVVQQLRDRLDDLSREVFEFHASALYVQPIMPLLERAGAGTTWPFEGLTFGEHLSWYGRGTAPATPGATPAATHEPPAPVPDVHAASGLRGRGAVTGLARQLSEAFSKVTFDLDKRPDAPLAGWPGLPEVRAAARLRRDGADDMGVRVFCTLLMAMDRARDAESLWQRGTELYATTPWVFDPAAIATAPQGLLSDALRGGGVSQRYLADSAAWRMIAESLGDPQAAPEVHRAVIEGQGDAATLLQAVEATSEAGTPLFPLLREPKIAPVWVRVLAYPGGSSIAGIAALPVAVDVYVRKVSEYLDVTRTNDMPLDRLRPLLQKLWEEDVADQGAAGPHLLKDTPAAVDAALRYLGRWGCSWCEQMRRRQPIHPVCAGCRFDELQRAGRVTTTPHTLQDSVTDRPRATARSQILEAAHSLTERGVVPFSPAQLIIELRERGSMYPDSTLRTHIVAAMCVNAPDNHAVRYPDLERVSRGQYRLYAPG